MDCSELNTVPHYVTQVVAHQMAHMRDGEFEELIAQFSFEAASGDLDCQSVLPTLKACRAKEVVTERDLLALAVVMAGSVTNEILWSN